MPAIEVALPQDVVTALRKSPAEVARDVRVTAAAEWYAEGLVSQGKAAELAGLSRFEFFDELAKRKVPLVQMTVEELRAEPQVFERLGRQGTWAILGMNA